MDQRDLIKTGDTIVFSSNTPTGFLLRTFVSSQWNHNGIAVRFIDRPDGHGGIRKEISLTNEGVLYVFETNTGVRVDDIIGMEMVGAAFSRADWLFKNYNKIAVRRLHEKFRNPELARLTLEFTEQNRGRRFPSHQLPFLSVWLGIPLNESPLDSDEMFCSQLTTHYYAYCIGPQYEKFTGFPFKGNLNALFGHNSPLTPNMFTPGHYTCSNTPHASIFQGKEEIIYIAYSDFLYTILQPLIIILIVMLIIWMSLH